MNFYLMLHGAVNDSLNAADEPALTTDKDRPLISNRAKPLGLLGTRGAKH